jgi:hypothetical protein
MRKINEDKRLAEDGRSEERIRERVIYKQMGGRIKER